MAALVAVVLAMATTLCGLAVAMIKGDLWKAAPHWLPYALFAVSGALYVLAAILALRHFRWERANKTTLPPATPQAITQHQEFNPQFNPTINIGAPDPRVFTIEQEWKQQEKIVLEYMRRQHEHRPSMTHLLGSIASAVGMTPAETDQILQRLFANGLVFRGTIDAPGDYIWWYRDLV